MDDSIERSILIEAPLDRVWELVTEPGWWVPADVPRALDRTPGSVTVRASEKYGVFPVQVVRFDPKTYAAFRWASTFPGEELTEGRTTLVEFHIAIEDSGVRVTVVESGFAGLDASDEVRQDGYDGNAQGWAQELDSLRLRAMNP